MLNSVNVRCVRRHPLSSCATLRGCRWSGMCDVLQNFVRPSHAIGQLRRLGGQRFHGGRGCCTAKIEAVLQWDRGACRSGGKTSRRSMSCQRSSLALRLARASIALRRSGRRRTNTLARTLDEWARKGAGGCWGALKTSSRCRPPRTSPLDQAGQRHAPGLTAKGSGHVPARRAPPPDSLPLLLFSPPHPVLHSPGTIGHVRDCAGPCNSSFA